MSTDPTAPAAAQAAPAEDKIPLLDVLGDLGQTLTQSELPASSQLLHVVGAVVKVLDHAGVEVADELWPAEPAAVVRPETQEAVHRQATNQTLAAHQSALERIEALLERAVGGGKTDDAPPAPAPAETAPPAGGAS